MDTDHTDLSTDGAVSAAVVLIHQEDPKRDGATYQYVTTQQDSWRSDD